MRHRPSQFVLGKLGDFKCFELYYFTRKSCDAAQRGNRANPDSFSLTQFDPDGTVIITPAYAVRKLKNVVPNHATSSKEIVQARLFRNESGTS